MASCIGSYQLTARLGAGGMGEVWRARDTRLGRDVAIKILPKEFAESAERLRRFQQEAKTLAALNHPNLLVIHDTGVHESQPYLVSELLEGETLRAALQRGPFSTRKASETALQLALGLAAAHAQGIVHRDLKPENVFLTRDNRVKILDFGLAKALERAPDGSNNDLTTIQETQLGLVLGTPGYMSPEQVRGGQLDPRSDIFAFGLILYEMLAGQRAFQKPTSAETMTAILTDDPPDLAQLNSHVPPALEKIARRCLEKQPQARFQAASDLAFALDAFSGTSSTSARPAAGAMAGKAPSRRFGRASAGWVAAGLVLLAAAGAWARRGERGGSLGSAQYRQITSRKGTVLNARFGPDGRTVYYSAKWGNDALSVYSLAEHSQRGTLVSSNAHLLAVSSGGDLALLVDARPDAWLSFEGTLARMKPGQAPRPLLDRVLAADWFPDGQSLLVARRAAGVCRLEEFPSGKILFQTSGYVSYPRVSPAGDKIAYVAHQIPLDNRGWVVIADRSGRTNAVSGEWLAVEGLAWAASGQEVWFGASHTGMDVWELHALANGGRERRLGGFPATGIPLEILPNGRALINRLLPVGEAVLLDNGHRTNLYLPGTGWVMDLSNDGKRYLFDFEGVGGTSSYTSYLGYSDGSPALQLGSGLPVSLSPDGQSALAIRFDPSQVVLLPVGMGQARVLDVGEVEPRGASWLPDGKRILVTGRDRTAAASRVYLLEPGKGQPTPVTPVGVAPDGVRLIISPRGDKFLARDTNNMPVVCFVDGSQPKGVPGLSSRHEIVAWCDDNESVFVVADGELWPVRIDRVHAGTGERSKEPVLILALSDMAGVIKPVQPLMTPDGKTGIFGYPRYPSDLILAEGWKE